MSGEGRLRLPAMTVALLFLFLAVVALVTMLSDPYQMDFVSYWAAARLADAGNPAGAYDVALHRAVELGAIPLGGALPFAYPPCFLLLVAPFGLLAYPAAAANWVLLTFAAYCAAIRRWAPDMPWLALSFPPLLINVITGQAGLLTAALFVGGMALLPKRPFAAGILLGLLIVKPQLGLVVPLALLAGREWRAIAGAAASAAGPILVSLLLFGWAPWQAWLANAGLIVSVASEGLAGWHRMAGVYGALRLAGLAAAPAWAAHALVGLAAAGAACLIWYRETEIGKRAAALAAATALASPYLFVYDTLILIVPFLWLIARRRALPLVGLAWAILFLALVQVAGWGGGPNLAPLAPIILLALILIQSRGLSASASDTEPLPRGAALG
ncbi:MAG TPA: glycosyltransferase family 87 protein [Allosphingosinicella sp.]|nr:glycosyltransferase family 87 protein [Allosphingosinicella sp.]